MSNLIFCSYMSKSSKIRANYQSNLIKCDIIVCSIFESHADFNDVQMKKKEKTKIKIRKTSSK